MALSLQNMNLIYNNLTTMIHLWVWITSNNRSCFILSISAWMSWSLVMSKSHLTCHDRKHDISSWTSTYFGKIVNPSTPLSYAPNSGWAWGIPDKNDAWCSIFPHWISCHSCLHKWFSLVIAKDLKQSCQIKCWSQLFTSFLSWISHPI